MKADSLAVSLLILMLLSHAPVGAQKPAGPTRQSFACRGRISNYRTLLKRLLWDDDLVDAARVSGSSTGEKITMASINLTETRAVLRRLLFMESILRPSFW